MGLLFPGWQDNLKIMINDTKTYGRKKMKKILRTCMLTTALSLAHSGMALSATLWDHTDLYNANGIELKAGGPISTDNWEFDILADGYDPATESVISAIVTLKFRDDYDGSHSDGGHESKSEFNEAELKLSADGSVIKTWEVDTGTQVIALSSLTTLSNTGLLSMTLEVTDGKLEFDTAQLDVHDIPTVPVPAAVWLFGSGLLGLVGVARARRKA